MGDSEWLLVLAVVAIPVLLLAIFLRRPYDFRPDCSGIVTPGREHALRLD
jgi:hypothetical protein